MSATKTEVKRQHTEAEFDLMRAVVEALQRHGSFSVDVGSLTTGAVVATAVDVSADGHGLEAGDEIIVTAESIPDAGLVIESAEVTAADEITVRVLNSTGGTIDPVAFNVYYFAPLTLDVL